MLCSRTFPSHTLPWVPRIFLTAPLSYDAVAFHLGQCEKLLRYGKLATSSYSSARRYCLVCFSRFGVSICSDLITSAALLDYIPLCQLELRENRGTLRLELTENVLGFDDKNL